MKKVLGTLSAIFAFIILGWVTWDGGYSLIIIAASLPGVALGLIFGHSWGYGQAMKERDRLEKEKR